MLTGGGGTDPDASARPASCRNLALTFLALWLGLISAASLALALSNWSGAQLVLAAAGLALASIIAGRISMGLAMRQRRLEILHSFTGSIARSVHLSEVAESVLRNACSLLRADNATLLLAPVADADPARRIGCSADGVTSCVSLETFTAEVDALVPGGAVRSLASLPPNAPAWLAELAPVRTLIAPLTTTGGDIIGALVLAMSRPHVFRLGDEAGELLGALADHGSRAIENGLLLARLEREAEVRAHQARHDSLTDLPNRARLSELLNQAVEAVYPLRGRVGLLVIDLDEFSQVSDAFGHESTDTLVVQACRRIRGLLPELAMLCRIGPNEFAAILPKIESVEEAQSAARMLIAGFDPPFQVEGVLLALGVNIGVAVYPEHAVDVPSLVQRAHIARDTARRLRSGWELYDATHDPSTPRRLTLGAELREALDSSELDVCYQPKVEVATGAVRGAEALVRWDHPRLGRVRPSEFIAVAEHTGDIRNLTMVVMRRALAECRSWRDNGFDLSVAVNLSARNLLDLHLVDDVARLIDSTGVPAEALTLELTESMVMSESQRSVTVLEGLNRLGVCLSCDDFGTGYSSLAHLRRLPIGEIKIDRSFVARMTVDDSDRAIARTVLTLGRDLGITTVAEGVESSDGWDMLSDLGCDLAQGFLVCPPLSASQFSQWLAQRHGYFSAVTATADS
jgi:diguanylate cyclase (GGDEF)-like protein